jgi:LemA protein
MLSDDRRPTTDDYISPMLSILLLALAVLVAAWLAWTFNRLVALRNRMRAAWASVDALLKRRADLIPNLVELVRGYMGHEQGTLNAVTEARNEALSAGGKPSDNTSRAHAENLLTSGVRQIFALAEAYPELKASENVLALQGQLTDTENDIASARRYYNAVVRDFNTLRESFPTLLVAGTLGFQPGKFFELTDISERNAPATNLGAIE